MLSIPIAQAQDNFMSTIQQTLTPALMNQRCADFWQREAELMSQRTSNPAICRIASRIYDSHVSNLPFELQLTYELILAEAEHLRSIVMEEQARRGGRARKPDALQLLIDEIVRENPELNQNQLFYRLRREEGQGVIVRIDRPEEMLAGDEPCIHFQTEEGVEKTASLSGLKDRLSRAKKRFALAS